MLCANDTYFIASKTTYCYSLVFPQFCNQIWSILVSKPRRYGTNPTGQISFIYRKYSHTNYPWMQLQTKHYSLKIAHKNIKLNSWLSIFMFSYLLSALKVTFRTSFRYLASVCSSVVTTELSFVSSWAARGWLERKSSQADTRPSSTCCREEGYGKYVFYHHEKGSQISRRSKHLASTY